MERLAVSSDVLCVAPETLTHAGLCAVLVSLTEIKYQSILGTSHAE